MTFIRKHLLVLLMLTLLFVSTLGVSFWNSYDFGEDLQKVWKDTLTLWGNLSTGVGMILVAISLYIAIDANSRSREASEFIVITEVTERLNSKNSRDRRGFLHKQKVQYENGIIDKVIQDLYPDGKPPHMKNDIAKNDFTTALSKVQLEMTPGVYINALDAIETTLLDLDLFAVPFYMKIKSAMHATIQWKSVLEDTSKDLIGFIDIMQRVRNDQKYKRHYLYMLHSLKIDIGSIKAPNIDQETRNILERIDPAI